MMKAIEIVKSSGVNEEDITIVGVIGIYIFFNY